MLHRFVSFSFSFLCNPSLMLPLARGDKKRATRSLRSGGTKKSHHFSTFRSGMYLGLAIPALVEGLVKGMYVFYTRELIFEQQPQSSSNKPEKLFLLGARYSICTVLYSSRYSFQFWWA